MRNLQEDEKRFAGIYESLWPKVYGFIYYKVQNSQEAEELTQDVFQRVYKQARKQSMGENIIKAYIFTAARNIIYDPWRKKGRGFKVIRIEELSGRGFEIEDEKRNSEDSLIVQGALQRLAELDRNVLVLRIMKGYTISEAAAIMQKPEETVKSMQFRALKKLRDILNEGGYFYE